MRSALLAAAFAAIGALAGCFNQAGITANGDMTSAGNELGVGSPCNAGAACPAGSFCEFPAGACGGDGVCVARPASCGPASAAMCGCDQNNYYNECQRQKAAASKLHDGTCQIKMPCFVLGEAFCKARVDCAADYCVLCSCKPAFNGCRDMLTPPKPCPTAMCIPPPCCRALYDCHGATLYCSPPEPPPPNIGCPPPCGDNLVCNGSGQCERQACAHDSDCLKGFCVDSLCYSELGMCTAPPG